MTPAPYHDSGEHLWEELDRIDRLVRAQTLRWRLTIGASKPEHLWGMVHVTDDEVDAYLRTAFRPGDRLPAELEPALAPHWEEARRRRGQIRARQAATPSEVPLRLDRLRAAFGLSELELDVVLVCLLPELDARYRRLYGYLQDDVSQAAPSVELVLEVLQPLAPGPVRRAALEGGGRLRRHDLVVLPDGQRDDRPLAARPVRLDDRVAAWLLGDDAPDARLQGVLSGPADPAAWEQLPAEPELVASLQALADRLKQRDRNGEDAPVLLFNGPAGIGRLTAARALCAAAGIPLLVAGLGPALRAADPFERIVNLCLREAALQDAALYWAGCEALLEAAPPPHDWEGLVDAIEDASPLMFLAAARPWHPVGRLQARPLVRFDFQPPGYRLRRRLWERSLPDAAAFVEPAPPTELAERLANDFQLNHGQLRDALAAAAALAARRDPLDPRLRPEDLWDGCRQQSGQRLDGFARRVEPTTVLTFEDLVLPQPSRRQLDELRSRIRQRWRVHSDLGFERRLRHGQGLVVMFTGASGTGKTMAAELLAREQGVDLYKVDLAAVVSKYVGETEKNLSQLFADAEGANAILFFDEADALFGKRGEVHDARDRWANIEVNYLLQRIEDYSRPRHPGLQPEPEHRRGLPAPHPRDRRLPLPRRPGPPAHLAGHVPRRPPPPARRGAEAAGRPLPPRRRQHPQHRGRRRLPRPGRHQRRPGRFTCAIWPCPPPASTRSSARPSPPASSARSCTAGWPRTSCRPGRPPAAVQCHEGARPHRRTAGGPLPGGTGATASSARPALPGSAGRCDRPCPPGRTGAARGREPAAPGRHGGAAGGGALPRRLMPAGRGSPGDGGSGRGRPGRPAGGWSAGRPAR